MEINDTRDSSEGVRLEYELLREQIADADKTCVTLLGALVAGSAALATLSLERGSAQVAWLLSPLWLVGHMYLAEKRSMILKTAYYIGTRLESTQLGLGWERWHRQSIREKEFYRYYPFYLECGIAAVVILLTPVFVLYLSPRNFLAEPWFSFLEEPWFIVSLVLAILFIPLVIRSVKGWQHAAKLMAADLKPSIDTPRTVEGGGTPKR